MADMNKAGTPKQAPIVPGFTPTSALITPNIGSIIVTLVMTKSNVPPSEVVVFAKPIPSRKVLPPP